MQSVSRSALLCNNYGTNVPVIPGFVPAVVLAFCRNFIICIRITKRQHYRHRRRFRTGECRKMHLFGAGNDA